MNQNQNINFEELFKKAHSEVKSLHKLLQAGRKHGFQNNINRKQIWPFLLNIDLNKIRSKGVFDWKNIKNRRCEQYHTMEKDVERSLTTYETFEQANKYHIKKKQQAILDIENSLFCSHQQYSYFQGFHEIVSILTILFDNSSAYYLTESVAQLYFYDFLCFDFTETTYTLSQLIYQLLIFEDSEYKKIFKELQHRRLLVFVLPWILSWFTRLSTSVKAISRVWDYILCTGPAASVYLCVGVILSCKKQLKCLCENYSQAELHNFFQKLPKSNYLDIEYAIQIALLVQQKMQLKQLKSYNKLHPKSMYREQNFYKTLQIHQQFHQQRINNIKKYKALSTVVKIGGLALLVGAAFVFSKNKVKDIKP